MNTGSFEWRAGTLSHKIAEFVQDQEVHSLEMSAIKHSSVVTSEALSVISKLNKPVTGFEKIELRFSKLDEKLSDTVLDQFVKSTQQLKVLTLSDQGLPEIERLNVLELASSIIES